MAKERTWSRSAAPEQFTTDSRKSDRDGTFRSSGGGSNDDKFSGQSSPQDKSIPFQSKLNGAYFLFIQSIPSSFFTIESDVVSAPFQCSVIKGQQGKENHLLNLVGELQHQSAGVINSLRGLICQQNKRADGRFRPCDAPSATSAQRS